MCTQISKLWWWWSHQINKHTLIYKYVLKLGIALNPFTPLGLLPDWIMPKINDVVISFHRVFKELNTISLLYDLWIIEGNWAHWQTYKGGI